MKVQKTIPRIAFFTIIAALFTYCLKSHLLYHDHDYGPSESILASDTGYIIPATIFEVAFIVLLWTRKFKRHEINGGSGILFTLIVIFLGAIPSIFFSSLVDELGKCTSLYKGHDPFWFYAVIGMVYLATATLSIAKKYPRLENAVYLVILLHSCWFLIWRLVLKIPTSNTPWGVGPT